MHTYICMHIYTYACTSILFTIHIHMLTQDIYTNTCLQEFPGGLEVKIPGYHYPD